jgi:phage terminase large subunit
MELVLTDKQYEYIEDDTRHLMIMGSAGSGKTIFACTKVILYALKYPNARIGVFRQTLPSLRETAWREIIELLDKYQIELPISYIRFILTQMLWSMIEEKDNL